MSQAYARPCLRCGTPLPANQRSCPNCGASVASDGSYLPATPGQGWHTPPVQHTPYPSYAQQTPQPLPGDRKGSPLRCNTPPGRSAGVVAGLAPARLSQPGLRSQVSATPTKAAAKGVRRDKQIGCGVGILALLVIVLLTTGGYFAISFIASHLSGIGTGAIATPAQRSVTITSINATITYAGVTITLVDVQQSASFPEDVNLISAPGEVRLDIEERNTAANAIRNFTYREVARLILPTSKSVAPVNAENIFAPESAAPRTNWLDFPVPTNTNVSELLLRLGKGDEARMDVLLRANVDVSRYQPRTVRPNITLHYRGMNWTITTATLSWSAGNQQASAGMRYVTLTLKADNPTSQAFSAPLSGYMQLKAGQTTSSPTPGSTFPPSIAAKATGTTGTAVFLVPQDVTAYTFVLVADSVANQASADFQI